MMRKCIICGFDKRVHLHHIIKRRIGGSNDKEKIIKLIKELTDKEGKYLSNNELSFLDKKIFVLLERTLGKIEKENRKEWRKSYNYETYKKYLLGRGCPSIWTKNLNEKAEKLLLIKKIEERLPRCE